MNPSQALFNFSLSPASVFTHQDPESWPKDGSLCLFALVDSLTLEELPPASEVEMFVGHFELDTDDEQTYPVILGRELDQIFLDADEIPEGHLLVYSVIRFNRKQED